MVIIFETGVTGLAHAKTQARDRQIQGYIESEANDTGTVRIEAIITTFLLQAIPAMILLLSLSAPDSPFLVFLLYWQRD